MLELALAQPLLQQALLEDIGPGDLTSELLVSPDAKAEMRLVARQPLIVAGLEVGAEAFRLVGRGDTGVDFHIADGGLAEEGEALFTARGYAQHLLAAERVGLNFLQRMCGVATMTRRFVEAVEGTGAVILDTRKTLPGWRLLDKYAVTCGGGQNHRMGLFDAVLIKDNHVALLGGVGVAVEAARARMSFIVPSSRPPIIVECDTLEQVQEAIAAAPERILLDNMDVDTLKRAVKLAGGGIPLEASGNITLKNARAIAETGVNFISIGRLTHSATAVDIGAELTVK
jgi:nicotinate-nucleotide pyrophosphorylase (carboxylating)